LWRQAETTDPTSIALLNLIGERGREDLLRRFDALATDPLSPATLMITHHIEEIPAGSTHALLLKSGQVIASGPIGDVVTTENLTVAYDMPISVTTLNNRFTANAIN
jgi:iron complex transport system ATP-binding protein